MAVSSILMSKTFDNGMICASEQSVIAGGQRFQPLASNLNFTFIPLYFLLYVFSINP